MTRLEKREQFGEFIGSGMTLFAVGMSAFLIWIAMNIGSFIGAVAAIVALIYICGGLYMRFTIPGIMNGLKALHLVPDTRHRVIAMEDYHGIDYTVIHEKHLYVKHGEKCELVIKRVAVET